MSFESRMEAAKKSSLSSTKTPGAFSLLPSSDSPQRAGEPHKTHFSFIGEEIPKLLAFISNLQLVDLTSPRSVNITDADLVRRLLSTEQARSLIIQNQDLILVLARSEVTKADMVSPTFTCRVLMTQDSSKLWLATI